MNKKNKSNHRFNLEKQYYGSSLFLLYFFQIFITKQYINTYYSFYFIYLFFFFFQLYNVILVQKFFFLKIKSLGMSFSSRVTEKPSSKIENFVQFRRFFTDRRKSGILLYSG
jgi:hypothetical protein